jgi:cytochrome P450
MRAFPLDPIAAVTHADPYPYYAHLVANQPLYRDQALGLWVASGADAVTGALASDLCRVRPPAEPVPKALLGSPAAEIFRHLVRMNDGRGHCPFKQAVSAALHSIDATEAALQSSRWTRFLLQDMGPTGDPDRLTDWAFQLPVHVVATLLGVPQDTLHQTALWMGDFVRCLAPASSPEQIERGKVAAGDLLELFGSLATSPSGGGLLVALAREARQVGRDSTDVIVANAIGFLSQAYEATAGLIGNTLVVLGSQLEVSRQAKAEPALLRDVVQEVLRYDPPIHNTRRFVARSGTVAGQEMNEGDVILVVLAAANRDPLANPRPERFEISRRDRRIFTFGAGIHACPGEALAATIAQAAIEEAIRAGIDPAHLPRAVTYRPSANARIPLWGKQAEKAHAG